MTLQAIPGDAFALLAQQEVTAFAHGVNIFGRMGAGVAADVARRWPDVFTAYENVCKGPDGQCNGKGALKGGKILPVKTFDTETNKHIHVYNLASQDYPGKHGRLEWVDETARKMVAHAEAKGITHISVVRIGCGIAGLSWSDVEPLLQAIETPVTLLAAYL